MTDYLYSYSLTLQTRLFLLSLGFGFLAGGVYDFFRAIRLCLGSKRIAYYITDILFFVVLGFFGFLFFLAFNEGEVRAFAAFGILLGFIIYIFSVGGTFISFFRKLMKALRRILTAAVKAVCFPFRKFFTFIRNIVKKHLKIPEKCKNKSKYPLKVKRRLLYNLFNRNQKGGKS